MFSFYFSGLLKRRKLQTYAIKELPITVEAMVVNDNLHILDDALTFLTKAQQHKSQCRTSSSLLN